MGTQTFIFVHDQQIVEDYIQADKFSQLPNVQFVFLGNKPVDRIRDRDDVIIAREQEKNIESERLMVAWTGWYAVWANGHVKARLINLFEYDINIAGEWKQAKSPCGYISHPGTDELWWNFNGIQPHIERAINQNRSDVDSIYRNRPIPMTSNYTLSASMLGDFVNELPLVEYKAEPMCGHIVERHCSYRMRSLPVNAGKISHLYADSHKTYGGTYSYSDIKQSLVSDAYNTINSGSLSVLEIKKLLGKSNPVILEIGANCGQTTIEFVKEFPSATIHCFEPDPRAISKFKTNITETDRLKLHQCAIGNYVGEVEFNQSSGLEDNPEFSQGWDHSSSIKKPKEHLEIYPWVKFDRTITVPISTLDLWAENNNISNVDFIWADVQGAEEDMIKGATKTLSKTKFLYTEYSNKEQYEGQINLSKICDLLSDFKLIKRFEGDALFMNKNIQ